VEPKPSPKGLNRVTSWFRQHPEISIGIIGGIILAVAFLIYVRNEAIDIVMGFISWMINLVAGVMHGIG
jgi:hypothetical protein